MSLIQTKVPKSSKAVFYPGDLETCTMAGTKQSSQLVTSTGHCSCGLTQRKNFALS